MDSSKIEGKAVRYVKEILDDCPLLSSSDVKEGDKEISWDGFVKIYKSEQLTKDNLLGRVFVQIKGQIVNETELTKEYISYQATVADLNNYLNDGGIIYFVVYIVPSGARKIFYETLTVVKLKDYLKRTKKRQASKSISLKALPMDISAIETIFVNFYEDAKKQKSFACYELLSLEELMKKEDFEGVKISTTKFGIKPDNFIDQTAAIIENEVYVYASVGGFEIPASNVISRMELQHKIDKRVTVEGVEYYNACDVIVRKKGQKTIRFGRTIEFTIFDEGRIDLFTYSPSKLHRDRLQALKFIHSASMHHRFDIGELYFKLTEDSSCNFQEVERDIALLTKIDELLIRLNIQEQLDLSKLSKQDYRNIHLLYEGIVLGKTLPNLIVENNCPTSYNIPLSNLRIKILVSPEQSDSEDSLYRIEDYFSLSHHVIGHKRNEDSKYYILSPYLILEPDEYGNISNMDYNKLVEDAIERMSVDCDIYPIVNGTLLNLLLAYDKKQNKNLLSAAERLAKLLMEYDTPELSSDAKMINYLQTVKRYRKFTDDEVESLINIKENNQDSLFAKIAVCLLLDDHRTAKIYFKQVESQDDKLFLINCQYIDSGNKLSNSPQRDLICGFAFFGAYKVSIDLGRADLFVC